MLVVKIQITFKLNLFNYAAKYDLKGATGINTSKFAGKLD